jgi:hypothetical protein
LAAVNNVALLLVRKGDSNKAEPLYRRAVLGKEVQLGPEHPDTLESVMNLAVLIRDMWTEEAQLREAELLVRCCRAQSLAEATRRNVR